MHQDNLNVLEPRAAYIPADSILNWLPHYNSIRWVKQVLFNPECTYTHLFLLNTTFKCIHASGGIFGETPHVMVFHHGHHHRQALVT